MEVPFNTPVDVSANSNSHETGSLVDLPECIIEKDQILTCLIVIMKMEEIIEDRLDHSQHLDLHRRISSLTSCAKQRDELDPSQQSDQRSGCVSCQCRTHSDILQPAAPSNEKSWIRRNRVINGQIFFPS
ncbi:hypothetical protein ACJJTC_013258 [Scirpophaga incertulas]